MLNELSEEVKIYRTASKDKSRKVNPFPNLLIQNIGRYLLSFVYIPDTKIKWKKKALELGESIIKENNIDVIFATAPPYTDFLVAYELSKKFDLPFVIDYRDLWLDNPYHFFPTPHHRGKNEQLEHEILAHADRIIVTTRFAKETMLKRYKSTKTGVYFRCLPKWWYRKCNSGSWRSRRKSNCTISTQHRHLLAFGKQQQSICW